MLMTDEDKELMILREGKLVAIVKLASSSHVNIAFKDNYTAEDGVRVLRDVLRYMVDEVGAAAAACEGGRLAHVAFAPRMGGDAVARAPAASA